MPRGKKLTKFYMIVPDSNIWVFGTLGVDDRSEKLLNDIERGEKEAAINGYVLKEVLGAFDRTSDLSPDERDELKTLFCVRLSRMNGLIEAPTSKDISDSILNEHRSASHTRLIARILEIQPKDVPILLLAFNYINQEPTILTNDSDFSSLDPASHNLSIEIEYVDVVT
jgi:predicted nucleic acid-binding protein